MRLDDEYDRYLNIIEFLMEEIRNIRRENSELKDENTTLISQLIKYKEGEQNAQV